MAKVMEKIEEVRSQVVGFFETATAAQLIGLVIGLEAKGHDFGDIMPDYKSLAFRAALDELKVSICYLKSNSKSEKYCSHLYLDSELNRFSLFINKKDRPDLHAMYVRLFDQHKDELLRLLDTDGRIASILGVV